MSEQSTEAASPETVENPAEQKPLEGAEQEQKTFDADYVANLRKEAAKYRTEAKAKDAELEKFRKASMTEAEKAVAEAEAKGRTAAMADFGKRLAKAELDTAAARRNPDFDTAALEYVDLSKFIGEDGEPDKKAIQAAVERLVPEARGSAPSFDGGARKSAPKGGDMNSVIRGLAGLG